MAYCLYTLLANRKIMESKSKCENCKFYHHSPNVLGGVAECRKEVKWLSTFWQNDACEKFEATEKDNLKAQNDFYKEHLGGAIQLNKGKQ